MGIHDEVCIRRGYPRVLLVEDNDLNRKVTMLMLRYLGYEADAVSNGIDALEVLEKQKYNLVLMNVHMPKMDGIEATREIRKRGGDQKIIALTASVFPGSKEMCLDAGMDGYIAKPINIDELGKVLSEYRIIAESYQPNVRNI